MPRIPCPACTCNPASAETCIDCDGEGWVEVEEADVDEWARRYLREALEEHRDA